MKSPSIPSIKRHRYIILALMLFISMANQAAAQPNKQRTLTKNEQYYYSTYLDERWGGLKPFLSEGKWGFQKKQGEIVVHPRFDSIKATRQPGNATTYYIIVREKGQWGVINTQGSTALPFEYEDLEVFYGGYSDAYRRQVLVKKSGKWGMRNFVGKQEIPHLYDSIGRTHKWSTLVEVKLDGKYGMVDTRNGQLVYPLIYEYIGEMSNQTVKVRTASGTGIINPDQKVLIPLRYQDVGGHIYENTITAKLNGKWGVADTAGREVFPFRYDRIDYYNLSGEGRAYVRMNNKVGEVDKTGKEIVPVIFDHIPCMLERYGKGLAGIGGKWGIVDTTGRMILPVKYDAVASWSDGSGCGSPTPPPTSAKLGGKWAYIDSTGKEASPFKYDHIKDHYSKMVPVKLNDKWGFINRAGQEITAIKYDSIINVSEESYLCLVYNKWGAVDMQGKEILPFVYDEFRFHGYPELGGQIPVKQDDKWGFIDLKGKLIVPPKYPFDEILPFQNGLAAVSKNGRWGYINKAGTVVVPLKYEQTTGHFFEGKTGVKLNDKWGAINKKGVIVEPFKHEYDPVDMDENGGC